MGFRINEFVLVCEYMIIAIASVAFFFASSIVMLPITYLIILLAKFKFIFHKQVVNCTDVMFRILDFVLFIFIGIFFILFWIAIDTIKFTINLFSKRIMLIDKEQQEKQIKINMQMDGSLKKNKAPEDLVGKDQIATIQQPIFKSKSSGKGSNPMKEGLSDTTFKIVKACCSILLEKHEDDILNIKEIHDNFIPTIVILENMRQFLLVQEQINAILMGVTYKKREEFFNSEKFAILVDHIVESEKEANILGDAYEEDEQDEEQDEEWIKRQKTLVDKEIEPGKKQFWTGKIIDYLTQSNEKWILDQFNLCKRFFLQNSIEGKSEDFYYIQSIDQRKKKKMKQSEEAYQGIFNSSKSHLGTEQLHRLEITESENPNKSSFQINLSDEKIMKCDIAALLKAIQEIEKRLKMEKILNKSEKEGDKNLNEMDEMTTKALRNQFSMLNFNRNYKSVKDALENPTVFNKSS
mmetsp:Transcript_22775/g.20248  ORF Transcript_22775/g.20248 Transcript_22775/m.20248 type:complete len:465 (+) Transcript_22775:13-1407(+)